MEFKIIWSESSIKDLQEIYDYISKDNPRAAESTGLGILEHVSILSSFPLIGPKYPKRSIGNVREIVYGNYRVFYQVSDQNNSVEIIRVWYGARGKPQLGPEH